MLPQLAGGLGAQRGSITHIKQAHAGQEGRALGLLLPGFGGQSSKSCQPHLPSTPAGLLRWVRLICHCKGWSPSDLSPSIISLCSSVSFGEDNKIPCFSLLFLLASCCWLFLLFIAFAAIRFAKSVQWIQMCDFSHPNTRTCSWSPRQHQAHLSWTWHSGVCFATLHLSCNNTRWKCSQN